MSILTPIERRNYEQRLARLEDIALRLKDPLIYYFDMLGERFAMRQARA
jgi:hypothetical protein